MKRELETRMYRAAWNLADARGNFADVRWYMERLWSAWARRPEIVQRLERWMMRDVEG